MIIKRSIEINASQITISIHPKGEIEVCHSCENRNPVFYDFSGFPLEFTPYLIRGGNDNDGCSNYRIAQFGSNKAFNRVIRIAD